MKGRKEGGKTKEGVMELGKLDWAEMNGKGTWGRGLEGEVAIMRM